MPLPLVAVVGRPNVGKSTFVNRIAQVDEAIVHEMRGVTRDRSYHEADWNGVDFKLIDLSLIHICAAFDSKNDHRLAMTWALAGLCGNAPVEAENFDSVKISYPQFLTDIERLAR